MVMRSGRVLVTMARAASLVACSSGSGATEPGQAPGLAKGEVVVLPVEPAAVQEDIASLREVGQQSIQRSRETVDPAALAEAERNFSRLLELAPDDPEAVIGLGTVALARHEFAAALELGLQAEELAPGSSRALGIIVDARIELGDYEAAGEALARMLRARPDLSSYSRLSYFHELHYLPALRGLARVAVAQDDLGTAITHLEAAVARVPLPDLLIELGETLETAGRADEAASRFELVRQIEGGTLTASAGAGAP
ncbi:hypothetical protein BH24CHL9_BH24CHL9_02450 [soil metagenome]